MNEFLKLLGYLGVGKREQLFIYAKTQLGYVKSGKKAPKEYGCAEAVNRVFCELFGNDIGGDVSTTRLYEALKKSNRFIKVSRPDQALRGDIIISPTGYGSGAIPNGHVGIFSDNFKIMSNDSKTGKWIENYDIHSWTKRYVIGGGYPIYIFRVIL